MVFDQQLGIYWQSRVFRQTLGGPGHLPTSSLVVLHDGSYWQMLESMNGVPRGQDTKCCRTESLNCVFNVCILYICVCVSFNIYAYVCVCTHVYTYALYVPIYPICQFEKTFACAHAHHAPKCSTSGRIRRNWERLASYPRISSWFTSAAREPWEADLSENGGGKWLLAWLMLSMVKNGCIACHHQWLTLEQPSMDSGLGEQCFTALTQWGQNSSKAKWWETTGMMCSPCSVQHELEFRSRFFVGHFNKVDHHFSGSDETTKGTGSAPPNCSPEMAGR